MSLETDDRIIMRLPSAWVIIVKIITRKLHCTARSRFYTSHIIVFTIFYLRWMSIQRKFCQSRYMANWAMTYLLLSRCVTLNMTLTCDFWTWVCSCIAIRGSLALLISPPILNDSLFVSISLSVSVSVSVGVTVSVRNKRGYNNKCYCQVRDSVVVSAT